MTYVRLFDFPVQLFALCPGVALVLKATRSLSQQGYYFWKGSALTEINKFILRLTLHLDDNSPVLKKIEKCPVKGVFK